ncbi:MAG: transcription-repair coupling factor, partial [Bacilli bacterium]
MDLINKLKIPELNNNLSSLESLEESLVLYQKFLISKKTIVVVKSNIFQARKLYNSLSYLLNEDNLLLYGFDDSLVVEALATSNDLNYLRIESLIRILSNKPHIIIMHTLSLIKPIINKTTFENNIISISVQQKLDYKSFINKIKGLGYLRVNKVSNPFEYAIRGSVIDIYSLMHELPIRIDLFDDEIESIKYFDITSQRTLINKEEIKIYPVSIHDNNEVNVIMEAIQIKDRAKVTLSEMAYLIDTNLEVFLSRYYILSNNYSSILDYINDYILVTSSYEDIINTYHIIMEQSFDYLESLYEENKSITNFQLYLDCATLINNHINISSNQSKLTQTTYSLFRLEPFKQINDFIINLKETSKLGYDIYIMLYKDREITIVKKILKDLELAYQEGYHGIDAIKINIIHEDFIRGFVDHDNKVIVYTKKEIFNENKRKSNYLNKYQNAVDIVDIDDLKKDDYIVHNVHGIGKYLGLIKLKTDNIEKDYLHIIYKNDEKLYIPIDQFNLIKKYSSSETHTPKLSTLGGSDWKKTKARVKLKIEDMMEELLELYAARKKPIGFAFDLDNEIQREFENDFEFNLTKDQEQAIIDVKKDMESNEVMDRLICGDVGYGKTEVAIRASMKAILSNKQVLFLCPTTILSRQHYNTIKQRFKTYPINVVQVTRHTSLKDFKKIIQDINDHKIDIIVGTHRILSKDLIYPHLGLLVIDEEQRFGVKDKEKIKQLALNVDVLTLSATPIPRTLQMSISGLRKMSLLQTPPINRMPIQTYVVAKNKFIIKEAIERELARNGQIFYLHNKTSDIERVAQKLSADFEDARVGYIHGKMNKNTIEQVMINFDQNVYNILVCTTIIETGIDIPNANTIIIEDANNFGLAQLYQIKGRVGRSNTLAYAYLLFNPNVVLNQEATKRLQAIKEFTKLGSGYKIAKRDLAIRGAGDI